MGRRKLSPFSPCHRGSHCFEAEGDKIICQSCGKSAPKPEWWTRPDKKGADPSKPPTPEERVSRAIYEYTGLSIKHPGAVALIKEVREAESAATVKANAESDRMWCRDLGIEGEPIDSEAGSVLVDEQRSAAYAQGQQCAFDESARVAQREWGHNESRQMYSRWGGSKVAKTILRLIRLKQEAAK